MERFQDPTALAPIVEDTDDNQALLSAIEYQIRLYARKSGVDSSSSAQIANALSDILGAVVKGRFDSTVRGLFQNVYTRLTSYLSGR